MMVQPIFIEHIQSLILYTDFSMLSSSFTSTFRKKYENESLESVKNRNSSYYWMSKFLIEAVNGYGYLEMNLPQKMKSYIVA